MAGTYQDFLFAFGYSESSNRYDYVNPNGHAGYYQIGEATLRMTGYYGPDSTPGVHDMLDGWTDKAKALGVDSLEAFLANPDFQDRAIGEYFTYLWNTNFEGSNLKEFIGQTVKGIYITASGLLAGSHLVGANNVETFLRSGGDTVPTDPFGTTVASYLEKFAGYDMSPVTGVVTSPSVEDSTQTGGSNSDTTDSQEESQDTGSDPQPAGQNLTGTNRGDELIGGQGGDTINGKNGKDWIAGEGGNDHLWGGGHADTFVFGPQFGQDVIEDFQPNWKKGDYIAFKQGTFQNYDDVMLNTVDTLNGALITSASGDDSILLKGVKVSDLNPANFLFIL